MKTKVFTVPQGMMLNNLSLMLGAICTFLILASPDGLADTVITYDDGSTYTLEANEKVFITSGRLFGLTQTDGVYSFGEQEANDERDHTVVEDSYDNYPMGSEKWCELYVPWSEGFTFNMQTYIRECQS